MTITWQMYAIVCPLAMLAGFVDSVAGGGGLISLPAYYLAGFSPVFAAGTNKLSACLGTVISSLRYLKGRKVILKVGILAALGAFPGSWLGATVLRSIPENVIRVMMIAAIPIVAAVVLRKKELTSTIELPDQAIAPVSFAVGLVIGFYDGLVGPGTGTFLILMFTMLLGMDAVYASGTAKIVNLASNVSALINMFIAGKVIWAVGLPAAACGMLGNWLGSGMTMKRGTGFIRRMLLVVLALLLGKMIWDVIQGGLL